MSLRKSFNSHIDNMARYFDDDNFDDNNGNIDRLAYDLHSPEESYQELKQRVDELENLNDLLTFENKTLKRHVEDYKNLLKERGIVIASPLTSTRRPSVTPTPRTSLEDDLEERHQLMIPHTSAAKRSSEARDSLPRLGLTIRTRSSQGSETNSDDDLNHQPFIFDFLNGNGNGNGNSRRIDLNSLLSSRGSKIKSSPRTLSSSPTSVLRRSRGSRD